MVISTGPNEGGREGGEEGRNGSDLKADSWSEDSDIIQYAVVERESSHDSVISVAAKTLERVDSGHGHYDVYYAASGLLVTAFKHGPARVEVEGAPRSVARLPPSPLCHSRLPPISASSILVEDGRVATA